MAQGSETPGSPIAVGVGVTSLPGLAMLATGATGGVVSRTYVAKVGALVLPATSVTGTGNVEGPSGCRGRAILAPDPPAAATVTVEPAGTLSWQATVPFGSTPVIVNVAL